MAPGRRALRADEILWKNRGEIRFLSRMKSQFVGRLGEVHRVAHLRRSRGALVLVLVTLSSGTASAFSPHGHETIESVAYRHLLAAPTGKETLRVLIRGRLLDPPVDSDGFPPLRTGQADSVLSRQAGTLGQCFHFMAEADDANHELAELTREDGTKEVIHPNTADVAYRRCIEQLTWLFSDAIAHPQEARQSFRGLYAMMHSMTDSYSSAHVERTKADGTGPILHLRPWRLLTFQKIPIHRGVSKLYFDAEAYHKISDPRDEAYLRDHLSLTPTQRKPAPPDVPMPADCRDYADVDPNFVPEGCLSKAASRAAEALVAFLELAARLVTELDSDKHAPEGCPGAEPEGDSYRECQEYVVKLIGDDRHDTSWGQFLRTYLKFQPSTVTPMHPTEITVTSLVGLTSEYRPSNEYWALRVEAMSSNRDLLAPPLLLSFLFADFGMRKYLSDYSFTLRSGFDLILPLTGRFSIGFSPFSYLVSFGNPWEFSLNTQIGFLDFYLAPLHGWVRLSGPDWNLATFVRPDTLAAMPAVGLHEFASVTIGIHMDDVASNRDKLTKESPDVLDGWSPKPKVNREDQTQFMSATVNHDHDEVLAGIGAEAIDTHDALGRTKTLTWGYGATVSLLQTEKTTGDVKRYGVVGVNPIILRLESRCLFLDLVPVAEGGYGNGWYGDLGGAVRVGVQFIGRLQIRVRSPRLSLADRGRFNGEILGIELGFRCWEDSKFCF